MPSERAGEFYEEVTRGLSASHLTYHLATALFFTGCRFHEWSRLTIDRLVREPGGVIIAAHFAPYLIAPIQANSDRLLVRTVLLPRTCHTPMLAWPVTRHDQQLYKPAI
jgi:hypothetical protein